MFDIEAIKTQLSKVPTQTENNDAHTLSVLCEELLAEIERLTPLVKQRENANPTLPSETLAVTQNRVQLREEKASYVVQLVEELVAETKHEEGYTGGLMRTFGEDYIKRMTTFAGFFQQKS